MDFMVAGCGGASGVADMYHVEPGDTEYIASVVVILWPYFSVSGCVMWCVWLKPHGKSVDWLTDDYFPMDNGRSPMWCRPLYGVFPRGL